jgi:cytochrome P450
VTTEIETSGLTRASVPDTLRVVAGVFAPVLGRGIIVRRPRVVALLEKADADHRLVRTLQRLRARYGPGPLQLAVPGRSVVLVLSPADVQQVLEGTPEPFATSTPEKRAALGKFQPHGVLVSHGADRADRRRFTEQVLETPRPVHHLAERFAAVVGEETRELLGAAARTGELRWDAFAPAWWRIVRRVVLGDGARDDHELTDLLARLRGEANWSVFHPSRPGLRERFLDRLRAHLRRAEPGSLAALVAEAPTSPRTYPDEQVPQWLFAFDAAGMATYRALALLATHPAERAAARAEDGRDRPGLRAALLESVRLWPTTPAILRETTTDTELGGRTVPAHTLVAVFDGFFQRDDETLPYADRFAPDIWRDGSAPAGRALVPFSAGPAVCAGRNLVLFLGSAFLAALLDGHDVAPVSGPRLGPGRRLPATLDPFRLRFALTPRPR